MLTVNGQTNPFCHLGYLPRSWIRVIRVIAVPAAFQRSQGEDTWGGESAVADELPATGGEDFRMTNHKFEKAGRSGARCG